jgi:hypothetical protein
MRLKDKIAIVVGAGQSPGEGMGNGRAAVLRFAQKGAKVLAVDNNLSSAEETVAMARQSGGECVAFEADVTRGATLAAMVEDARLFRFRVFDFWTANRSKQQSRRVDPPTAPSSPNPCRASLPRRRLVVEPVGEAGWKYASRLHPVCGQDASPTDKHGRIDELCTD